MKYAVYDPMVEEQGQKTAWNHRPTIFHMMRGLTVSGFAKYINQFRINWKWLELTASQTLELRNYAALSAYFNST